MFEVLCESCEQRNSEGLQQAPLSSISRSVLVNIQLQDMVHGSMMHRLGGA
jgi:hypothetical protein